MFLKQQNNHTLSNRKLTGNNEKFKLIKLNHFTPSQNYDNQSDTFAQATTANMVTSNNKRGTCYSINDFRQYRTLHTEI